MTNQEKLAKDHSLSNYKNWYSQFTLVKLGAWEVRFLVFIILFFIQIKLARTIPVPKLDQAVNEEIAEIDESAFVPRKCNVFGGAQLDTRYIINLY